MLSTLRKLLTPRCSNAAIVILLLMAATAAFGRPGYDPAEKGAVLSISGTPNIQYLTHDVGQVGFTITNTGFDGKGYLNVSGSWTCEFPIGSNLNYLFGSALWVGAVVGNDTLVSVGADGWYGVQEFFPDEGEAGTIITQNVISDQDFICSFADTTTGVSLTGEDPYDNRPHMPLYVEVKQKSYAWAQSGLNEFILFERTVKNIGQDSLHDVWVGLQVDGDVLAGQNGYEGCTDDITGFLSTENLAYITDNDGDPRNGAWDSSISPRGAIGLKFLGSEPATSQLNYNWYISNGSADLDFGPRLAGTAEDSLRLFPGGVLGTPGGDKAKYYILSHNEKDYDQLFTAVSHEGEGFLPPPTHPGLAATLADGADTRFLLSFGPSDINPGDSVRLFYSYVMGNNVHVNSNDYRDYFSDQNPQAFYDRLDFSSLIDNAHAANNIYCELVGLPFSLRGDANGDGQINVGDAVSIVNYIFRNGSAPDPKYLGDANCDGRINVGDAVYLINYIFRSGPAPCSH